MQRNSERTRLSLGASRFDEVDIDDDDLERVSQG
jgi:hypothetical protein